MSNKKKKPSDIGFFFRHDFKDQLRRMQTVEQVMEVLDAASDYTISGEFNIKDPLSDMAFSSWKPRLDYDKAEYKAICERNTRNSLIAKEKREQKKREQAKASKETAPPSDDVPLKDVEEVERYPFEEFWTIYGKNIGYDRCLQVWENQLSDETKAKIMEHVVKYVQARPNEYFRKDPINYFKDKTYNDEVVTNIQSASNYGSNNRQRDERTQQQINIERNAQAVARMFSEIRPMQTGDN